MKRGDVKRGDARNGCDSYLRKLRPRFWKSADGGNGATKEARGSHEFFLSLRKQRTAMGFQSTYYILRMAIDLMMN